MFTGIVETTGILADRQRQGEAGQLFVKTDLAPELAAGASIAVNGACLTIERIDRGEGILEFHTMAQTLDRTNLGELPVGRKLNLERPLKVGDRLGGHLVSGHIDSTAKIVEFGRLKDDLIIAIELPEDLRMLIIDKGSIAVDGISLTVAALLDDHFRVNIIPYTWEITNLAEYREGESVNLEMDMVGKFVLRREALLEDQ